MSSHDKGGEDRPDLFLYHIADAQQGITPEEIANSVLIERAPDSTPKRTSSITRRWRTTEEGTPSDRADVLTRQPPALPFRSCVHRR